MGRERTVWVGWMLDGVVRHGSPRTPSRPFGKLQDRLTTNGPEPVTFVLSLSKDEVRRLMKHPLRRRPYPRRKRGRRGTARRLGCCGLCGSTRVAGDGAPAHHERLLLARQAQGRPFGRVTTTGGGRCGRKGYSISVKRRGGLWRSCCWGVGVNRRQWPRKTRIRAGMLSLRGTN